jgi:NAD(P)-dependent dehydrogenase (short-subunit alcohol dehydrogenase family)
MAELIAIALERQNPHGAATAARPVIDAGRPWLRFLGWWQEPTVPSLYGGQLDGYVTWMRDERGFTSSTVERLSGKRVPAAVLRGVPAEVGSAAGCAGLAAAEPTIDLLVNNAAIFRPTDVFETTGEQRNEMFAVNVIWGIRLSRAYLRGMAARGWGRVIFMSSASALNIPVKMIDYGVTKTAVLGLSRGLAKRMAGTKVTVNAVLPGPTLSERRGGDAEG